MLDQTLDQLMFLDAILAQEKGFQVITLFFDPWSCWAWVITFISLFVLASLSSHAALRIQQSAEAPPKQVSTCLLGS